MIPLTLRRLAVVMGLVFAATSPALAAPSARVAAQGTDHCGVLIAAESWDGAGSPHRVTCTVQVPVGLSLTIQPGVEVRFDEATFLDIRGTLTISGAGPSDVLLTTSQSPSTPGSWRGIIVAEGGTAALAGFTLQYAGARSEAALRLSANGVTVTNAIIEESASDGIAFERVNGVVANTVLRNNAGIGVEASGQPDTHLALELTGNTFDDNEEAAVSVAATVETILSGNRAEENGLNAVVIDSGSVDADTVLHGGDMPYFLGRALTVEQRLTVQPGTVIKSFEGRGISVSAGGTLIAVGTPEQKVVITSLSDDVCADTGGRVDCDTGNDGSNRSPGPADWGILNLKSVSRLQNAEVRYGRDNMITIDAPGIGITSTMITFSDGDGVLISGQSASIVDSHITDNKGHAISVTASAPIELTLRGNTFERNDAVVSAPADVMIRASGNSTPGHTNKTNGFVVSGDMTVAHIWSAGDLPYVINGSLTLNRPSAELLMEPGLLVKMTSSGWLRVARGQLNVGAAGGEPVLITTVLDDACSAAVDDGCDTNGDRAATSPAKGSWRRIEVSAEGRGANIRSAVIRYGGNQHDNMVFIEHAQSVIQDTIIASSSTAGMLVSGVNSTSIERNTFRDNNGHGLVIRSSSGGSTVTLRDNTFEGNVDGGAGLAAAVAIDANVQLVFDDTNDASGNELNGIAVADGDVTTSRVWAPSKLPFVILDDVIVKDGATLTVQPGTIIKLNTDRVMRSDRNGALLIEGTEGDPVILTSIYDDAAGGDTTPTMARAPNRGDWLGVQFRPTSRGGRLHNAELRYGGGDDGDPFVEIGVIGVTVRDSIISEGSGLGILIDDVPGGAGETVEVVGNEISGMNGHGVLMTADNGPTQPTVQNNHVSGSQQFAFMADADVSPRLGGNTAEDNLVNGIGVRGTLNLRRTWERSELPWVLDGAVTVAARGWLEIEAGTVVKARPEARLSVSGGTLIVPKAGSGTDPVIFTSVRDNSVCAAPGVCDTTTDTSPPRRGEWIGIAVSAGANPASLDNIELRYAGNDRAALVLDASNSKLANSVIAESGSAGLSINRATGLQVIDNLFQRNVGVGIILDSQAGGTFTGNIFTENERSIIHESSSPTVTGGNIAVGNEFDAMLYCADVSVNTTWSNDLVREIKTNCGVGVDGGTLTIEPGTLVEFTSGGEIVVNSRLEAEGVVFTGSRPDAPAGTWKGLRFTDRSAGFSRHNLFIASGGASRGGLAIEASGVVALYNTLIRMNRTALSVADGADPEIRGNVIRDVVGSDSAAIRVSDENTDPVVQNNLIAGTEIGLTVTRGQPRINGNDITGITNLGVENKTRTNCVEAKGNWWGSPTGPRDTNNEGRGCGPGLNENGTGIEVGDDVDYANWLVEQPPAAPVIDLPMCGATNQRDQMVAGRSSPGATVFVFDGEREVAQITVGGAGRFEGSVTLGQGSHGLSFEARKDGNLISPRTGFRLIDVDDTVVVDPSGIRFEYGPSGDRRLQPLRSASGCATPCGSRSSGRVELPPGEEVVVSAPVSGQVTSVEFVQEGQAPRPMTNRGGGVYATEAFVPVQAPFTIRVDGGTPVECFGYVYPGGGGFVFSDSGVDGNAILTENFEGQTAAWRLSPPWGLTDNNAFASTFSLSTNPSGGKYGANLDASAILPGPIDLTAIPSPEITFQGLHNFAPRDKGLLEIQSAGGSWSRVAEWEDANGAWTANKISLEEWGHLTQAYLRFRLDTNANSPGGDGWWIDNIEIAPGGGRNGRYDFGEPLVANEEVLLEQRNLVTGLWEEWDPLPTGQSNPQQTDGAGRYGFYNLPPGEYRIRVGGVARSPVLAVWTGTFDYEMPVGGTSPIYLPITAKQGRIGRR